VKTAALIPLFLIAMIRVGTSIAAPPGDLATASLLNAHTAKGLALHGDGAHYKLGNAVGLFVDYKEMRPASGALSPLETGLPAKPPVRLGRFLVSAGIRVYLK